MSGGRTMLNGLFGLAVGVAMMAVAAPLEAQWRDRDDRYGQPRDIDRGAARTYIGIALLAGNPVGEFGRNVDDGFGLNVEGRFPVVSTGAVSLRLDGGFLVYGNESRGMCFPVPVGCRIGVELNTTNSLAYLGLGPEVSALGPVSPYVNGSVGLSYFFTHSSLSGADDYESNFNTTNYSDLVTTLRFGGGVRFALGRTGGGPFLLDLGAQYHRNGVADYLREGDIVDHPDGSITLYPRRSEANLVTFNVGVSFAVGGGRDRDDGRGRDRDRRR